MEGLRRAHRPACDFESPRPQEGRGAAGDPRLGLPARVATGFRALGTAHPRPDMRHCPQGHPNRRRCQTQRQGGECDVSDQDGLPPTGGPDLAWRRADRRWSSGNVSKQRDGVGLRTQHPADHRCQGRGHGAVGAPAPHAQAVGMDRCRHWRCGPHRGQHSGHPRQERRPERDDPIGARQRPEQDARRQHPLRHELAGRRHWCVLADLGRRRRFAPRCHRARPERHGPHGDFLTNWVERRAASPKPELSVPTAYRAPLNQTLFSLIFREKKGGEGCFLFPFFPLTKG